mmetsp:Transcript_56285/g.119800  ORF Transcript_56285/g.119800 Transcript_56285/m.119800 type:complete len:525 (+) Transcript_56285:54-1628(+)
MSRSLQDHAPAEAVLEYLEAKATSPKPETSLLSKVRKHVCLPFPSLPTCICGDDVDDTKRSISIPEEDDQEAREPGGRGPPQAVNRRLGKRRSQAHALRFDAPSTATVVERRGSNITTSSMVGLRNSRSPSPLLPHREIDAGTKSSSAAPHPLPARPPVSPELHGRRVVGMTSFEQLQWSLRHVPGAAGWQVSPETTSFDMSPSHAGNSPRPSTVTRQPSPVYMRPDSGPTSAPSASFNWQEVQGSVSSPAWPPLPCRGTSPGPSASVTPAPRATVPLGSTRLVASFSPPLRRGTVGSPCMSPSAPVPTVAPRLSYSYAPVRSNSPMVSPPRSQTLSWVSSPTIPSREVMVPGTCPGSPLTAHRIRSLSPPAHSVQGSPLQTTRAVSPVNVTFQETGASRGRPSVVGSTAMAQNGGNQGGNGTPGTPSARATLTTSSSVTTLSPPCGGGSYPLPHNSNYASGTASTHSSIPTMKGTPRQGHRPTIHGMPVATPMYKVMPSSATSESVARFRWPAAQVGGSPIGR